MRNQDLPISASFRGLPAVPVGQVVTGLIPHEPPNFQTPPALALLSSPVCVVTGQRGVGKTQVAAAYARQRVRDGWLVAWIGAETSDQIKAGLVELADRLGLYEKEDSADTAAKRARNHLQTRSGPALLVFDNVTVLDSIKDYLPSVHATQVVITTTVRGSQIGQDVPVEVFVREIALRFLREATGLDDDAAAGELAREVGYLPLALAQAAAQIRVGRWDYAKYLERFRKFPAKKYLCRRDGDPYPLGAATAIMMALEPFQSSELVQLLSVLSPEGISRQVLGDDADDELAELYEASLVEFAGDSSVLIHRLVQRVVRDLSSTMHTTLIRGANVLFQRARFGGDPWAHRHLGNEFVRQIEALSANVGGTAQLEVLEPVLIARLWAANFLISIGDFTWAGSITEEVYSQAVERFGQDHEVVFYARQTAARGTLPGDMSVLLEQDLTRCKNELGVKHENTLTTAMLLSRHYTTLDRADDAVAVLEQALEPWRDGTYDTEFVAAAMDALGTAYLAAGRAADTIELLEPGVRGDVRPDRRLLIRSVSTLATAYRRMGRDDDALVLYERARDEYQESYGPDHPFTLRSAIELGLALIRHGREDEAGAMLHQVLTLGDEARGEKLKFEELARALLEAIQQD